MQSETRFELNPIILAIETSTDACSVAIYTPRNMFSQFVVQPQAHSKILLGLVDEMCADAGIDLDEIDALAFGSGPGSFTGVRIAASAIQGLAVGLNKPIIAISSLQALAQQVANSDPKANILALIDARMQEIYCGIYKANAQGLVESLVQDSLQKPSDFLVDSSINYVAVGTGAHAYADILQQNNANININQSILHPRAQEVAQLATAKLARGETLKPEDAIPTYIRNDVAQKGKKNPD
jgi:tRNA threonylcarbamoyladenosine biosynthesis protein TsaB